MNKMNKCDLCGSESSVEFTVKSKHLRWVLSEDLQKLDTRKNNWLTKDICEDCFRKIFGKPEEEDDEYELPEPFGEKPYRPFQDTVELILHYEKHFNVDYPSFYEPMMWVKNKEDNARYFITGYGENYVMVDNKWMDMDYLFENFVFLDNSLCGSKE